MSTTTPQRPRSSRDGSVRAIGALCLALGGIAFVIGGATHPKDSGTGNKVEQLHDMLVDGAWYPSHLVLVASFGLVAAGVWALRHRGFAEPMARVVRVVSVVAVVATVGMTVHLFAAVGADSLADGEAGFFSWLQTGNEILVDATWGVAMAVLAVVGGATHTLGNRLTLVVGAVGAIAFAVASATIAFTDLFDSLFPVSSLLGLWALVVGVVQLRGVPTAARPRSTPLPSPPPR